MDKDYLNNSVVQYVYLDGKKQCIKVHNQNEDPNTFLVPIHETNTDYQLIQEWISEGNTVIDNGE
jgi:hypothetical protein|tara:strand:+ start:819 stop:1013 length:195 start_codon:yes stop_codon:yes gene_type:complete